ncbi:MAG: DNA polymerase III subunit delta [Legionellales bacterium]|nr:DNA polymerase III subunit delta [Legionellales bacterium]
MQIKADRLVQTLQKPLLPVYLIHGDEPVLQQQAIRELRQAAHAQGYQERESHQVTPQFNWETLTNATQHFSLFSDKRLFEIHLTHYTPGQAGAKVIQIYCQAQYTDWILLITANKLDQAQLRTKWVKTIDQCGAIVTLYPISDSQLPQWIEQRLQQQGMQATPDAIQLLARLTIGNLLATQQEIDKLALLFPDQTLTLTHVEQAVMDDSQYSVFQLVDHALLGDLDATLRALTRLQLNHCEPRLVMWSLIKEVRLLLTLSVAQQQGIAWSTLVQEHRIWQKRVPIVRAGLTRHTIAHYRQLLHQLVAIDAILKGARVGCIWDALTQVCMKLAQST